MGSIAESAPRSEINRAPPEHNSRLHPKNKAGAEAAHAAASTPRRRARIAEAAGPMRKMQEEILFFGDAAPATEPSMHRIAVQPASVNRSNRSARIKLDLAERRLVVSHVLLQERHERLGLLRAKINPLEVSQFHL